MSPTNITSAAYVPPHRRQTETSQPDQPAQDAAMSAATSSAAAEAASIRRFQTAAWPATELPIDLSSPTSRPPSARRLSAAPAETVVRSALGQDGVMFIGRGAHLTVAKVGRHLAYDWVATHIAELMGCCVAGNISLTTTSPQDAALLAVQVGRPLLEMDYIAGRTLSDLSLSDKEALASPASSVGVDLLRQMGRVMALDWLTGNPDRFPGIGLDSNPGNLMVHQGRVYCIDNSLARFFGREADLAKKRERTAVDLRTILSLAVDLDHIGALAQMQIAVGLLQNIRLSRVPSWDELQGPLVRGFRDGVASSLRVDAGWVETLLAHGAADDRVSACDGETLQHNLRQFHAAARAMTATTL